MPKDSYVKDKTFGQTASDSFFGFLSAKTEKLASVTYLLTDFLSDNEPLKWRIRQHVLEISSEASSAYVSNSCGLGGVPLEKILGEMTKILSLLDILLVGSSVSKMNFSILHSEYRELMKMIEERLSAGESVSKFLAVGDTPSAVGTMNHHYSSNKIIADKKSEHPASWPKSLIVRSSPVGYGQIVSRSNPTNQLRSVNSMDNNKIVSEVVKDNKKDKRQEQIKDFLKDKSWMGISDIAKALPDCGAKTVQRELAELVEMGVLKKQGDRRWSRYLLNN